MSSIFFDHRKETLLLFGIVLLSLYLGDRIGQWYGDRIITVFATFGLVLLMYGAATILVRIFRRSCTGLS